ncbi:hypothetical protein AAG570_003675 [Ranatra chinensis]|uniref:Uncharacterized protein n=1 Tax=Ranatra chinensis TaxID=642074 RepID=A0ABD0Y4D7_9HEMI
MASKRQNMFYENCTDDGNSLLREATPLVTHPDGKYENKEHYSTRSRGQRLFSRRDGFKGWVKEDREDTRGLGENCVYYVEILMDSQVEVSKTELVGTVLRFKNMNLKFEKELFKQFGKTWEEDLSDGMQRVLAKFPQTGSKVTVGEFWRRLPGRGHLRRQGRGGPIHSAHISHDTQSTKTASHCLNSNDKLSSKIPDNLKECYNGSNMMVKDNLLPMTMKVFIELIRKAESSTGFTSTRSLVPTLLKRLGSAVMQEAECVGQDSKSSRDRRMMFHSFRDPIFLNFYFKNGSRLGFWKSAMRQRFRSIKRPLKSNLSRGIFHHKEISSSEETETPWLARFRFDGIQSSPNVQASDLVIPYSPKGKEFFIFKILMPYLIPSSGQEISNDTFTLSERCTLHQMLSLSIDPWDRPEGDTACSRLSKYPNYNISRRPRRSSDTDSSASTKAPPQEALVGSLPKPTSPNEEVEIINPKKDQTSSEDLDGPAGNIFHPVTGQDSDFPLSGCPMENGVVYEKSGAVCPGVVLAGIAAGLQPQKVPPNNIMEMRVQSGFQGGRGGPGPKRPVLTPQRRRPSYGVRDGPVPSGRPWNSPGGGPSYSPQPAMIDNKWGATVSGLLAEIALLQGPVSSGPDHYKIGVDGGWNDTSVPRYWFLTEQVQDPLTMPRIRGALDGLIIASNIDNWNSLSGSELKLSQLLEMYYSDSGVFDRNMKACNRKSYVSQAMPTQDLKEQTYSFMSVLQNVMPDSVEIEEEGLRLFSEETSGKLSSTISSMGDPTCPATSGLSQLASLPMADLHIVPDCSWDNDQLIRTVTLLGLYMDWGFPGTNVTAFNGKTGLQMFSASSLVELFQSFYMLCNRTVSTGFDMRLVMNRLKVDMSQRLDWEKRLGNVASTVPRIILFLPAPNSVIPDSDKWYIQDKLSYFNTNNPDIKFLYLVPGSKDRFSPYAETPDKDIFPINQGDSSLEQYVLPLVKRISEIPRRVINPTCGSSWSSGSYGTLQTSGYLDQNEIQYYRVQPNYFYKDANAKISIQSADSSVVLNVCTSRYSANPTGNNTSGGTSGSVTCRQVTGGRGVDMWLSDSLCPNSLAIRCDPFYFSVSASQASQSASQIARCIDADCELPTNTKYVLSHQGLSCYSGIANIVASPIIIVLTILASLMLTKN